MSISLKPQDRAIETDDYLVAAEFVANWLEEQEVVTDHGIYWDNGAPKDKAKDFKLSLYSGSAGVLIFYLELYLTTSKTDYLKKAESAGDYLIYELENMDLTEHKPGADALDYPHTEWMTSSGHLGEGWALIELYEVSKQEKYKETAYKVFETFVKEAEVEGDHAYWTGQPCIMLDGGMVSFLIEAAKFFEEEEWINLAIKAGNYALTTEIKIDEHISKFNAFDTAQLVELVGAQKGKEYEWPNFIMGTAGMIFLFAKYYQISNNEAFLIAAKKAASYIKRIEHEFDDKAALVPLRLDKPDLFYVGYCHGPNGTARGFQLLYEITGEEKYRKDVERYAQGLVRLDAPELHSRGYWHSYNFCCGTAAILDFFVDIQNSKADQEYLELAERSAAKILSEGVVTPTDGAKWYGHWNRNKPTNYGADVGYFDGAAGIGSSLLKLYNYQHNKTLPIQSPLKPAYKN